MKRHAFWLIAAIIGIELLMIVMGATTCMYGYLTGLSITECANGRFSELIGAALAVAVSLYISNKDGDA